MHVRPHKGREKERAKAETTLQLLEEKFIEKVINTLRAVATGGWGLRRPQSF